MIRFTVTLYAWWLIPYLAVGLMLCPIFVLHARAHTTPRRTVREAFWPNYYVDSNGKRTNRTRIILLRYLASVVAWPVAAYEALS